MRLSQLGSGLLRQSVGSRSAVIARSSRSSDNIRTTKVGNIPMISTGSERPRIKLAGAFLLAIGLLTATGIAVHNSADQASATKAQATAIDLANSADTTAATTDSNSPADSLTPAASDTNNSNATTNSATSTTIASTSTNNGPSGTVSNQVTVNGKPVTVPTNGSTEKVIQSPDGQTTVISSSSNNGSSGTSIDQNFFDSNTNIDSSTTTRKIVQENQ